VHHHAKQYTVPHLICSTLRGGGKKKKKKYQRNLHIHSDNRGHQYSRRWQQKNGWSSHLPTHVRRISNRIGKGIKKKKNTWHREIHTVHLGREWLEIFLIIIIIIKRRGKVTVCQQTLA